jgi:hypothetical protein
LHNKTTRCRQSAASHYRDTVAAGKFFIGSGNLFEENVFGCRNSFLHNAPVGTPIAITERYERYDSAF